MWGRIIVPGGMSDTDAILYYCATTGAACRFSTRAPIAELALGANLATPSVRAVVSGPYFSSGDVVLLTPAGLKAAAALMGPIIARSPAAASLGFVWHGDDRDVATLAEIIEDIDREARCARAASAAPPEPTGLAEQVQRDLDAERRRNAPQTDADAADAAEEPLPDYDPIAYRGIERARPVRIDHKLTTDLRGRKKLVAPRDLAEPLRSLIIAARDADAADAMQYVWPTSINGRDTWTVGTDLADIATATATMNGEGVLYGVTPDRTVVVFAPVPVVSEGSGDFRAPTSDDDSEIEPGETDTSIFKDDAEVARVDRLRRHSLLTKEILSRLPKIRATEKVDDPIAQVKFFSATHGFATWYLTEYDPKTGEGFGWATLGPGLGELGYIDVRDLAVLMAGVRVRGLSTGTKIPAVERDLYWKPRPLSQAICESDPESSRAPCNPYTRKPYDPADLDAIREFNEPAESAEPATQSPFAATVAAVVNGLASKAVGTTKGDVGEYQVKADAGDDKPLVEITFKGEGHKIHCRVKTRGGTSGWIGWIWAGGGESTLPDSVSVQDAIRKIDHVIEAESSRWGVKGREQPTRDAFATAAHAVFDGVNATVLETPVVIRGDKITRLSASFSPNRVLIPGASGVASFSVSGYPGDGPVGVGIFEVDIKRPDRAPDAPIAMVRMFQGIDPDIAKKPEKLLWTGALWLGFGTKPSTASTVSEMIAEIHKKAVQTLKGFADQTPAGLFNLVSIQVDERTGEVLPGARSRKTYLTDPPVTHAEATAIMRKSPQRNGYVYRVEPVDESSTDPVWLTIEAVGNKDYPAGDHRRTVRISPRPYQVSSWEDASAQFVKFIEEQELSSGNLSPEAGTVRNAAGKKIGRIAFNGRVQKDTPADTGVLEDPAPDFEWTLVQSGDVEIGKSMKDRGITTVQPTDVGRSWWRKDRPEPAGLTREDIVKLVKMRRLRNAETRCIPATAVPAAEGGWRLTYDEGTDTEGYEGNPGLWIAKLYDEVRPWALGLIPVKRVVDEALEQLDALGGGSGFGDRVPQLTLVRTDPVKARQFHYAFDKRIRDVAGPTAARIAVNTVIHTALTVIFGREPTTPTEFTKPPGSESSEFDGLDAGPTRKISGSRGIPKTHQIQLRSYQKDGGYTNTDTTAVVSQTEVIFRGPFGTVQKSPDEIMAFLRGMSQGMVLNAAYEPVPVKDVARIATWVSVLGATPTSNGQQVRLLFGNGILHRAIIKLDEGVVACSLNAETKRDVPFSVFVPTPPAVVQIGPGVGQHLTPWQVEAVAIMLRFLGHDGLDNSEGDSATPAADPDYRTVRDGASPSEIAMIAAANALVVPLGQGDATTFKVMEFTKQAMDALDRVRHDPTTVEIVRRKIGEAQVRAGLQGPIDGADEAREALQRRLDRQEAARQAAPHAAPSAPPPPITEEDIATFQGKAPYFTTGNRRFIPSYSQGEYVAIWRYDFSGRSSEKRWSVIHAPTSMSAGNYETAVEAFNLVDRVKGIPVELYEDGKPNQATKHAFSALGESMGDKQHEILTARRRDGAPPANAGATVVLRHALLRSPKLIAFVRETERSGADLFDAPRDAQPRLGGLMSLIHTYGLDSNDSVTLAHDVVARLSANPETVATGWVRDLPVATRQAIRDLFPFVGKGETNPTFHQVIVQTTPSVLSEMGPAIAVAVDGHSLAMIAVQPEGALPFEQAAERCVSVPSSGPLAPSSGFRFVDWHGLVEQPQGTPYFIPDIDMKAWEAAYELPISDDVMAEHARAVKTAEAEAAAVNARVDARIAELRKEATPLPEPWRLTYAGRELGHFRTLKLATERAHEHKGAFFMFRKDDKSPGVYYGELGSNFGSYAIEDLSADARAAKVRNAPEIERLEAERLKAIYAVSAAKKQVADLQVLEKVPPMNQRVIEFRGGAAYIARANYPESSRLVLAKTGIAGDFELPAIQWVRAVEFVGSGGRIHVAGDASVVRFVSGGQSPDGRIPAPRRQVLTQKLPRRKRR